MGSAVYKPLGMRQDESFANFDTKYAFENKNIRINTTLDKTQFSLSNEKGNKKCTLIDEEGNEIYSLVGNVIGEAIINQYWVLFTTSTDEEKPDRIYRLNETNKDCQFEVKLLVEDNMNFSAEHPIEAITYYETDKILKVYWTDGYNQPRMLNILDPMLNTDEWDINRIEVIPNVNLNANISISKNSSGGYWSAGTVLYFITYVNKYGQESNIVYSSPLYYLTNGLSKALDEESTSNVSFKITVDKVDKRFKYVRIYSVHRPYQNGTPLVKLAAEIPYTELEEYVYTPILPIANNLKPTYRVSIDEVLESKITDLRGKVIIHTKRKHEMFSPHLNFTVERINDNGDVLDTYSGQDIPKEVLDYIDEVDKEIDLYDFIQYNIVPADNNDGDEINYESLDLEKTVGTLNIEEAWANYYTENDLYEKYLNNEIYVSSTEIEVNGENLKFRIYPAFRYTTKEVSHIVINDPNYDTPRIIYIVNLNVRPLELYKDLSVIVETNDDGIILYCTIEISNVEPENEKNFLTEKYEYSSLEGVRYTDTNMYGEIMDPTYLLYVGGTPVTVLTIALKNGVLFLGNLELLRTDIPDEIITELSYLSPNITFSDGISKKTSDGYNYSSLLDGNSSLLTNFKTRETYRFGLQLQDNTGKWYLPIFLADKRIDSNPTCTPYLNIPQSVVKLLQENNYTCIRPLVVYPLFLEREVICQGIACPTLYNILDRRDGGIHNMYSWFIRSRQYNNLTGSNIHNTLISENTNAYGRAEIQNIEYANWGINGSKTEWKPLVYETSGRTNNSEQVKRYAVSYGIDESIFTVHSPDIEFEDLFKTYPLSDIRLRVVGIVTNPIYRTCCHLEAGAPLTVLSADGTFKRGEGYKKTIKTNDYNDYFWNDYLGGTGSNAAELNKSRSFNFPIYPWHRIGSLNNSNESNSTANAVLERKIFARMNFFCDTKFFPTSDIENSLDYGTTDLISSYYVDSLSSTKMLTNVHSDVKTPLQYKGLLSDYSRIADSGYNVLVNDSVKGLIPALLLSSLPGDPGSQNNVPVVINFKCGPHIISGFRSTVTNGKCFETILPDYVNLTNLERGTAVYRKLTTSESGTEYNKIIAGYSSNGRYYNGLYSLDDYLLLVEFYRSVLNKFGGTTEYAITNNQWNVGGQAKYLNEDNEAGVTISWTEGDTYLLRYDCLRTMPRNSDDANQVVEIASFYCETRVNIDGRYDNNRLLDDYTHITGDNFNLINTGYTQNLNYFTYRSLTQDKLNNVKFPNLFTWTKLKQAGSTIDSWTNITLANIMDLNGDLGEIRAIRNVNDNLVTFLDNGISLIKYNENVLISGTNGVPIELANSNRVQGFKYISNTIGCKNKWTIKLGLQGIYFVDSYSKNIYLYSLGGNIENISLKGGMRSWSLANINDDIWNASNGSAGFRTFIDWDNDDILFVSDTTCLAYGENHNMFTSFYSYEGTKFMSCLNNGQYMISNDNEIYKHNAGEYNLYYDNPQDFYTKIIVNDKPLIDKIFNTVEFRADLWKNNKIADYNTSQNYPINFINVYNEYQTGHSNFIFDTNALKRKFRIWRANIPRADLSTKGRIKDRIRNTWVEITLGKEDIQSNDIDRTTLHDIIINYT